MTEPLTIKELSEVVARYMKYDRLLDEEWGADSEAHECASDIPRLLNEITRLQAENMRMRNRVDMLEEHEWPFEWVVATDERERRKAAEARARDLEDALKNLLSVFEPEVVAAIKSHMGYTDKRIQFAMQIERILNQREW